MPYSRPRAATLPASQSSSRRFPASRSFAIEALIIGGKAATNRSSSTEKSDGNSTPAARPTAIVSRISRKKNAPMCSSSRMTPRGGRVLAVMPDVPERTTNFFQFEKHVIAHRYVDSGSLHLLHVTGEHGIGTPVETAAVDFGHCAGVADHAGPRDVRDNIGRPRNRGLISKDRGESLDAVNAVLKRDHTGIGADERARLLTRHLGIPELYGETHHVDCSDLLRIVGDVGVLQMKVAEGACYRGAVPAKGIAMFAARHAPLIMTRLGQR